jgi:hypothetical protein
MDRTAAFCVVLEEDSNMAGTRKRKGSYRGQAWAGKSVENVGESLIFGCDPRKLCEEWNL